MPSLDLITEAERRFGLPVLSAATAGAYTLLRRLDLDPTLPGAGQLLAGKPTSDNPIPTLEEVP
jgi:maleate isomerase